MKKIEIIWQRLVDEKGTTCDRCNKTFLNLESAIEKLKPLLDTIGMEVSFNKKALSMEEFKKNPLASNEIIINGEKIEDILDLKIGQSCCCGPCGDSECRTIIDENGEKEEIEERLIIKAILKKVVETL
mgnify:CR=1 FL=1